MKIYTLIFASLMFQITVCSEASLSTALQRLNRKTTSQQVRAQTNHNQTIKPLFTQPTNGDEELYTDKRGSYGKGLKQASTGFVDPVAFKTLVNAIKTDSQAAFNSIIMGTSPVARRLHSPQAAFDINLVGADGWIFSLPAPPALTSAEKAGEMVELYWHALTRDVSFFEYDTNPTIAAAAADLSTLSDFKGPKINGQVTPQTIFRLNLPGVLIGPYVSQFLWFDVPFSDTIFQQRYNVPCPVPSTNDFMTTISNYLFIETGNKPTNSIIFDPTYRYITTERCLGNFVHNDPPQLPYIYTLCILLGMAKTNSAVLDPANPYLNNPTQEAFADFNMPQFLSLIAQAGDTAIRAAWYQKWNVNRTLRPEALAYLIHQQVTGAANYNLNSDLINSAVLPLINQLNQTINGNTDPVYLLPQAYPEGSPLHPTYPAGHATVAGACVTMLKAFFNEDFILTNPVIPDSISGNTTLTPYIGDPLTIGGELNKLGANIAVGRNMAGVHYRSDAYESMLLGEQVALAILEDWAYTMNISFAGFSLTTFDGTKIIVGTKKTAPQVM